MTCDRADGSGQPACPAGNAVCGRRRAVAVRAIAELGPPPQALLSQQAGLQCAVDGCRAGLCGERLRDVSSAAASV